MNILQDTLKNTVKNIAKNPARLRANLLSYYDDEGRTLPWRIRPKDRESGVIADPYAVWLSEIMCQQTTIAAVIPYWKTFLAKWPTVNDLAAAPRDHVLAAWAGLGYYARARNLHTCAMIIAHEFGGVFPQNEAALLKLPGIGAYTAAAIASICYNEPVNVVDGNVERVISRLYRVQKPLPSGRAELRKLAGGLADPDRPGDYAQALMDLGSQICKPKNPSCDRCPWRCDCDACANNCMEDYPRKTAKKERPKRYGAVFFLEDAGKILLRRRPDKGLLGGMMELPGTQWEACKHSADIYLSHAPAPRNWQQTTSPIEHVFSHFTLHLDVFMAQGSVDETSNTEDAIWADLDALENYALPSLMHKAIRAALPD